MSSYKYWAFISYSHQDKVWGDWLHKALETYRVPGRLVGRASRDGAVPKRLFPIFRDREELPTSSDLGSNINEALKASRYLIVICSPKSAVSKWVNEEVKAFKAMGREDRTLCLIVDGEPNASDKPNSGLLECFPEAVRYCIDGSGQVTTERTEPIAADAREGKDGRANAKLKVLAGLLGVGYDELRQREKQRQFWRRIQVVTAGAVLLAATTVSYYRNEREKSELLKAQYTELGRKELLAQRPWEAAVYLSEAYGLGNKSVPLRFMLGRAMAHVGSEMLIISGHTGAVSAAEYSPNDKYIVTASDDKTARIWDAASGKQLAVLSHPGFVSSATFSPDSKVVITSAEDGAVRVWECPSGKLLVSLKHGDDAVFGYGIFRPEGMRVLTFGFDDTPKMWDPTTGRVLFTLPGAKSIWKGQGIAVSPDGKRVAAASGGELKVWDVSTGTLQYTIPAHGASIWSVAFSPDGGRIVTASEDRTSKVWSSDSGRHLLSLEGHWKLVLGASFNADGSRILTFGQDRSAKIWDAETGRLISSLDGHAAPILLARFGPKGNIVLTASEDGTSRLWDATTGIPVALFDGSLRSVAFSADGARLLTSGSGRSPSVWNLQTSALRVSLRGHSDIVWFASFSRDGLYVVTASDDKTARIWNAISGEQVRTYPLKAKAYAAAFSPDGLQVAIGGQNGFVQIVNTSGIDSGIELRGHSAAVRTIEYAADGKRLLTGSFDGTAKIWDAGDGKLIRSFVGDKKLLWSARFSPDGRRLVTAGREGEARIWDAENGAQLTSVSVGTSLRHAIFTRDGTRVVTLDESNLAKLWDTTTGKLLVKYEGGTRGVAVTSADFSPDGSLFATTSLNDSVTKVWETDTAKLLFEAELPLGSGWSVRFNTDGSRFVAAEGTNLEGSTGGASIYASNLESRSFREIADILRCRVPWKIERQTIVRTQLDPFVCSK